MPSQGPLSPATFDSDPLGESDRINAWTNPGNVGASDDSYATATATFDSEATNDKSEWLIATNFGFSIPSGATIDGILVEAESSHDNATGASFTGKLYHNGSLYGSFNFFSPFDSGSLSEQLRSIGGSSDLLGFTDTWSEINSSLFGVAVEISADGGSPSVNSQNASIDHIRMTVYYTEAVVGKAQPPRHKAASIYQQLIAA